MFSCRNRFFPLSHTFSGCREEHLNVPLGEMFAESYILHHTHTPVIGEQVRMWPISTKIAYLIIEFSWVSMKRNVWHRKWNDRMINCVSIFKCKPKAKRKHKIMNWNQRSFGPMWQAEVKWSEELQVFEHTQATLFGWSKSFNGVKWWCRGKSAGSHNIRMNLTPLCNRDQTLAIPNSC